MRPLTETPCSAVDRCGGSSARVSRAYGAGDAARNDRDHGCQDGSIFASDRSGSNVALVKLGSRGHVLARVAFGAGC